MHRIPLVAKQYKGELVKWQKVKYTARKRAC